MYWLPSSEKIVVGGGNDGLEALGRAVNDAQLENRQAYTSVRVQNFTSCVRLLLMTQRQRNVVSSPMSDTSRRSETLLRY